MKNKGKVRPLKPSDYTVIFSNHVQKIISM